MTTYTFTTLNAPLATAPHALGINDAGQIVGDYTISKSFGFLYSRGSFTTIVDFALNGGGADGINDLGQIVGTYANGVTNLGFLYSGGTYTTLFDPSAVFGTFAEGINDAGQVVGFFGDSGATLHGFLYAGGTYTTLNDPSAVAGTQAYDINDAGQVAGTYKDLYGGTHGFLYSGGTYTTIDDPLAAPGPVGLPGQTHAMGINDAGWIVGYYYDHNGIAHGFLDVSGYYVTVDFSLASGGTFAQDINDHGEIAGYYSDATGDHSFIATPSTTDDPPTIDAAHSIVTGTILSTAIAPAVGTIAFVDLDFNDRPTASIVQQTAAYRDAEGHALELTPVQLSALESAFTIVADPNNAFAGKINWSYSVADVALDFLSVGQTITIDSTVQIDDQRGGTVTQDAEVTISGPLTKIAYTYTTIDDPLGTNGNVLEGINSSGLVVGAYYDDNENSHGYVYDGSHFTPVDDPLASVGADGGTSALEINNSGQVVGYYIDSSGDQHGYVYSLGTYTALDGPSLNAVFSNATGINNVGQITGYYADATGYHGFLYIAGTYTPIDDLLASSDTLPRDINDLGQIIGIYTNNSHIIDGANFQDTHGFLYSNGVYTTVDYPYAPVSPNNIGPVSINDAGQIVGMYRDGTTTVNGAPAGHIHGYLYSQGTYTTIDVPGADETRVSGITDDGHVIGTYLDSAGMLFGFVYTAGAYFTIDGPTANFGYFGYTNFNNSRELVGAYLDNGLLHGLLAIPFIAPLPNHVPVASNIAANANEDTNILPVTLKASYTDADLSDTFTFADDATGTVGLVTNNHDGTFVYDPHGKFEYLGVGETATDTFTYTVTDNHGASSTATATVTIHGENDAPSALADAVVAQKGAVAIANTAHGVLVNDSDPDIHDTLHVSKVNGLSTNVGHAIIGAYGTLTLNADGSYSYSANRNIPALTNKGGVQDQFAYSIDDGHGGTASSRLTVTVQTQQALNHAPVLSINPLDANKDEGNSGTTPFTFVVTRDDNASGSTTVDWAVGPANAVTADGQDFIGGAFPTGTATFNTGELSKTITVNVHGDTLYESNGKTENFVVSLSNPSGGATISSTQGSAVGRIHNDDLPLQTAKTIFASAGTDGEIVTLATLAQAAYHLVPGHELTGAGINLLNPDAEVSYNFLPAGLQILTTADLSLPTPIFNDPEFQNFPTNGLIDGIYLHGNAAALVVRSSDSVFVAFRGTNDLDHTPSDAEIVAAFSKQVGTLDLQDWSHMGDYYELLRPLIDALNSYINDTSHGIKHVYVTGHSLGAAMAQQFMTEHATDARFDAVTFASPGYNAASVLELYTHADDARILNIHVNGDPIQSAYPFDQLRGDDYVIRGAQHIEAGGPHDMALYYTAAQFLNNNYPLPLQTLPRDSIATNGIADTVNVFADIVSQPAIPPGLATWHVTLPNGSAIPIVGTSGMDYMNGGTGNDEMIGGSGNDLFVFNSGRDTVLDFRSGEDVIQLTHSLFKNFAAVRAAAQNDGSGNTVISDPINHYDAITLLGVAPNQLHAYDFHIV